MSGDSLQQAKLKLDTEHLLPDPERQKQTLLRMVETRNERLMPMPVFIPKKLMR
jgi:hypothetical protein